MKRILLVLIAIALPQLGGLLALNNITAIHSEKVNLSVGQHIVFDSFSDKFRDYSEALDQDVKNTFLKHMDALAMNAQMRTTGTNTVPEEEVFVNDFYHYGIEYIGDCLMMEKIWNGKGHEEIMELLKNKAIRQVVYREGIKLIVDLCRMMPRDFYDSTMLKIEETRTILETMQGHTFYEYQDYDDDGDGGEWVLLIDDEEDYDLEALFPEVDIYDLLFFVRRLTRNDVPVEEMLSTLNQLTNSLKQMKLPANQPQYLAAVVINDDLALVDGMGGVRLVAINSSKEDEEKLRAAFDENSPWLYRCTMMHDASGNSYQLLHEKTSSYDNAPSYLINSRGHIVFQF